MFLLPRRDVRIDTCAGDRRTGHWADQAGARLPTVSVAGPRRRPKSHGGRFPDGDVPAAAGLQHIRAAALIGTLGIVFTKIGGTRTPRVQPTLTRRDDGVVEISGGDAAGTTEFYDPVTNTFGDDPAGPSIVTDRNDYAPGEMVTFTGARWVPGELVTIKLREVPAIHGELVLSAFADENGTIINTDFAP
jgi:hypothetical protein